MAIIAISRQLGSGGYTIASAVATALGYAYADREVIMRAARDYEVPEAEVAQRGRASPDPLGSTSTTAKLRTQTFIHAAYYAIAEKDDVVTAGRGIASLVGGISHALRVRIIAPFETRVERVMRKENLDRPHAASRVKAYDPRGGGPDRLPLRPRVGHPRELRPRPQHRAPGPPALRGHAARGGLPSALPGHAGVAPAGEGT